MKTLTTFLLLFLCCTASANDFGLEVGIGVHPENIGRPEFALDSPVGIVEASYKIDKRFRVVLSHMSALREREAGYGVNTLQIRLKLK